MSFNFPLPNPYPSQLELMQSIYDCLDEKRIGFFESPTGTGKTLTLICGALSWLANRSSDSAKDSGNGAESEPEWMKTFRAKSNKTVYEPPSTYRAPFSKKLKTNEPSSIDDTIKHLLELVGEKSNCSDNSSGNSRANNFGYAHHSPKIFFCSRTHSQLAQVMDELGRTSFFRDEKFHPVLNLALTLASRSSLCVNDELKSKISGLSNLNDACQDLLATDDGCPFFNSAKDPAFSQNLRSMESKSVLDIEDLLKSGRSSNCCSYYSSKYLIRPASFIAAPYNYILHKKTREAFGINLSDSIVIFDEAHNMVDFVNSMYSFSIPSPDALFTRVVNGLELYLKSFRNRLSGQNVSIIFQLQRLFSNLLEYLNRPVSCASLSTNDLIYGARIDNFNFSLLSDLIEDNKLFYKILDKSDEPFIPSLENLLNALQFSDADGRYIIGDNEFRFIFTNPSSILNEVFEQCRSVIFCGGTMSPLQDTVSQLVPFESLGKVVSKTFPHIISPDRLCVSYLTHAPSGQVLNFSYDSRNDEKTIRELGIIITNYCRVIPAGLIVFFTSFAYLDEVARVWRDRRILEGISKIKTVFIEEKGSCQKLLADFEKVICDGNGALILAVMNGKLSEGVNFKDDLGRGIIVVGLPYLNPRSPEVVELVNSYTNLQKRLGNTADEKSLQGEFLENSCMRTINQTIGRAIRHKNDHAAIIFIDERAGRESIVSKLPIWVQQSFECRNGRFETSFKLVSEFFKKFRSPPDAK